MDDFLAKRIAEVAIWARNNGFGDVCAWMMAKQKREHDAERKPRARKVALTDPRTGKRVRGGYFYVAMGNDE